MNTAKTNPKSNSLGAGISERDVAGAISKSGYPLQTILANSLRQTFQIQEEWSYIDRDTRELRTLDILAEKRLFEFDNASQPRIRPTLDILIECKQSNLPYIFFLTPEAPWLPEFPALAGLFKNSLTLTTDDDASTYHYSILHALGLARHDFLSKTDYCMTFSKCVRKGSDLELSGTDAYQNLVLPLLKALLHFQNAEAPPTTAYYFDCHLALAVAVLDAPMIGVDTSKGQTDLVLMPWVRVARHESYENRDWTERFKTYAIDIVHKDYFESYLKKHLLPYASRFSDLALKHQQELATGEAFAYSMSKGRWDTIEDRLQPRRLRAKATRWKLILSNIISLLHRGGKRK